MTTLVTHNEDEAINIDFTHKATSLHTSLHDLVELFGEPLPREDREDRIEWNMEFDNGEVATIYSYEGARPDENEIIMWNIGAHTKMAGWNLLDYIEERRQAS